MGGPLRRQEDGVPSATAKVERCYVRTYSSTPRCTSRNTARCRPVARLLVWRGVKNRPLPEPPAAARTYAEFPEDCARSQNPKAAWENGEALFPASVVEVARAYCAHLESDPCHQTSPKYEAFRAGFGRG